MLGPFDSQCENCGRPYNPPKAEKPRKKKKVILELEKHTFAVQYNPNCPSPYLVRLCGVGAGGIDNRGYHETKDACGYGKTLEEAAERAIMVKENQMSAFRKQYNPLYKKATGTY